ANFLIAEVRRFRIAALTARSDSLSANLGAELDGSNKAVSGCPISFLRIGICSCSEGRQRSPLGGCDRHWNAGSGVVEALHNISWQTLVPVDVAPRHFPRSEIVRQFIYH